MNLGLARSLVDTVQRAARIHCSSPTHQREHHRGTSSTMKHVTSITLWCVLNVLVTKFVNGSPAFFGGANHAEYVEWIETSAGQYSRSSFLPSLDSASSGVALHWTIEGENIRLAVAARATGWVGFGTDDFAPFFLRCDPDKIQSWIFSFNRNF